MILRADLAVERASASEDGTVEFVASTNVVDRMGDIVEQNFDLKSFKKNPVFLWGHNASALPIGKIVKVWSQDRAKASGPKQKETRIRVKFVPGDIYPFAEQVRQLYAEGFLKAVSIGFRPMETGKVSEEERQALGMGPWGQRFTKSELLEVSAVSVPANPEALQAGISKGYIAAGSESLAKLASLNQDNPPDRDALDEALAEIQSVLEQAQEPAPGGDSELSRVERSIQTLIAHLEAVTDGLTRVAEAIEGNGDADSGVAPPPDAEEQEEDQAGDEPSPEELALEALVNELDGLSQEIQA